MQSIFSEGRAELDGEVAVNVSDLMENTLPRLTDTYAIWLYTLLKVRICVDLYFSSYSPYTLTLLIEHSCWLAEMELSRLSSLYPQLAPVIGVPEDDIYCFFKIQQLNTIIAFQTDTDSTGGTNIELSSSLTNPHCRTLDQFLQQVASFFARQPISQVCCANNWGCVNTRVGGQYKGIFGSRLAVLARPKGGPMQRLRTE